MHQGQHLNGRYELLERLGQGGMGDVWKARDQVLPRYVAIKGLSEESAAGDGNRRRLELEADTLAGLRHARVVPIIDKFTEDDQLYLVMEFIEGTDLKQAIAAGALSEAGKVAILTGVLEALAYLHEETSVVHRDLKPANVLLDLKSQPYVADFGIARSRLDAQGTQTQGIIGSRPYMAREVLAGETATPASDVWSFGAIALELFTWRTPDAGIPEGNFAGSLTADIRAALSDVSDRRPSAAALLASFRRVQRDGVTAAVPIVAHHESAPVSVPPVRRPASTPPVRRRWIPVLLLVVALAAISTAAYAFFRPGASGAGNPAATAPSSSISTPTPSETPTPSQTPPPTPAVSETPSETPVTAPALPGPIATTVPPVALSRGITEGRIEISTTKGKLGPGLYDVSTRPGYEPYVYTAAGRLGEKGCYAQWRLVNNGKLLDTKRTPCEASPISSEAYWPNMVRYEPGTVEVTADITTDWGATTKLRLTFQMVKN